ncbi:hypothetical protein [Piscibacillus halophilus]|uniref:hypothetical protein n=1 Tax=Piscibacillus halophilus TaxID=571933 RepID=UPI00158A8447|nr:hypothetical protein [Piscibacillus halophilus]
MKKIKRWCLGLIVAVIGLVGYFVVEAASEDVEFTSVSHAGVQHSLLVENEYVYIGKNLKWPGEDLPVIHNVSILTKEGEELDSQNDHIQIELLVDDSQQTQILYGELSDEQTEIVANYEKLQDYQMTEPQMTMVMQVKLKNPQYQYHLDSLNIEYTIDGKTRTQQLPLKNFIFH